MGEIKFVKEPGYTYDLIWVYLMYFNKDYFLRPRKGYKRTEENIEYFQKVLDEFAPISKELGVFFYMPNDCKAWMMQWFWGLYKKGFVHGDCMMDKIQEMLKNHDMVIRGVLKFYFKDITAEMVQECRDSLKTLNRLIQESDYSGELKSALYAFFIDPVPVIQKLAAELLEKMLLVAKKYEEHYEEIMALQSKLSFERMAADMKKGNVSLDLSLFDEVFVTVGCLSRQEFGFPDYNGIITVYVGLDYEEFSEWRFADRKFIRLDAFGTALSEKNRIDILDFMLRRNEVTQREIEKELNMTSANSYYHMSLLIKANMIKRRNQGRTILYSINKECVNDAIHELSKYAK